MAKKPTTISMCRLKKQHPDNCSPPAKSGLAFFMKSVHMALIDFRPSGLASRFYSQVQ
jgi:hypothetical protein